MTNPTPNQEERFNLNDMIDRLSLVIDIACTIQHRRNDLSELIASGDIDSILAILSPKYTISGLAIDTSLVTQSLNTIAKAGWVFQPHLNPIVARIAQLLLIRRSWAAKAYKVGGAALGSLVVILLCVHFIQGARYAIFLQIVRAPSRRDRDRTDLPGNQTRVRQNPGAQHAIDALFDNIDLTVGQTHFDFDFGVGRVEPGQCRNHHVFAQGRRHIDFDFAFGA